jgi:uncharacterized protein (DUF1501 family)
MRDNQTSNNSIGRRDFLRRAACAAVGSTAVASTVWDLRLMNAAVGQSTGVNDYKALVCIFLYGGNDGNNLIVPTDSATYSAYNSIRPGLSIPQNQLVPITAANPDGHTYGFHPACPELAQLFNQGKLAALWNVGTLCVPTTRAQFQAQSVPLPGQLFSHNDQQVQWQTSLSDIQSRTGWGGRMADLLHTLNTNATVSMSMTVAGANVWEVGNVVSQYNMSTGGSIGLDAITPERMAAVRAMLNSPHSNLFERAYAQTMTRGLDNDVLIKSALASATPVNTVFPETTLGKQLKMIAKLISARNGLKHKRQIFFTSVLGYDLHGGQAGPHHDLLRELSTAMKAFYDATVELGVASNVTTFTGSDFGRTLATNGGGSDHGWGNHQLIMGGAVRGQRTYGQFPTIALNGPNDSGLGRWIPTVSVDEYSATLAKWFGVSGTNLYTILPNLSRFTRTDLGFMA